MSGPWDDYAVPAAGPWADYAQPQRPVGEQAARMVGQFAQGANDAIARTVAMPLDASAWIARQTGLVPEDTTRPSAAAISGIDYLATLPARFRDAITQGSAAPLGDARTSRFDPENKSERYANTAGEALGTTAGFVAPASAVANTATGLTGKISGTLAAQPGMQLASNLAGNLTTEATGNPALGFAASFGPSALTHGVQRTVSAAPAMTGAEAERRALLAEAQKEGIPVAFGKIVDNRPAQMAESVLSHLPFVGSRQVALNEKAQQAFNKAALDKVPELKGQGLDAATPGAMESAFQKVSNKFNGLVAGTTLKVDGQFGAALQKAEADMSQQLQTQIPQGLWKQLQEMKTAASTINQPGVTAVTVDGRAYQNIRSDLSAQLSMARGTDKKAIGGMIDALDGLAERSLPKDMVKDWREARRSWRVLSMIDDAVSARHNGQSAVGNINPGSLDARVGNDKEMGRLAQVGMKFVGDKMPNSGTPERLLLMNLAKAGGIAGGGAAVGFPTTAAALAASGVTIDTLLNNPITRKALLARYAHPTQGVMNKGLVATLAAEQALQDSRR